jgi:hypothetical protein
MKVTTIHLNTSMFPAEATPLAWLLPCRQGTDARRSGYVRALAGRLAS